ncbi:MAG: hypothetical protein N2450_06560 [bacterium]|nr:hypothetical protein [bacterium]
MKRKKQIEEPVRVVEIHTEKFGNQYRAIIKLSNGEEREAIADDPTTAQIKVLHGLEFEWSLNLIS